MSAKTFAAVFVLLCLNNMVLAAPETDIAFGVDGLSQLSYDAKGPFAIGDSVDSLDLSLPKQRCINYQQKDVISDTSGSTSSKLSVQLVRSYDDAQRKLNFSYSYQASAKVDFAKIVSGESSLTASGSYERFFREEHDSVLLIVEAFAEHGRDYIENYPLQDKYQKLIDARQFVDFQQQCGTHFIRGVTRVSRLRVAFTFSNLTKTSKDIISQSLGSSGGVTMGINALSAGGKTEMSSNLSVALGAGSKLGKVSYDVSATGGVGVATIGKLLAGANLASSEDISKLLDGIVAATSDFTRTNSAPEQYILIPYPETVSVAPPFNTQRYDKLGELFRALLRIDAQREIYSQYQKDDAKLWAKYFQPYALKLNDARKLVLDAYASCRRDGKCDAKLPTQVDGIFLQDILANGQLNATCPLSYAAKDSPNAVSSTPLKFVSSFLIDWKGQIRFLDDLDIAATELLRIGPDLKVEKITFRPDLYARFRGNNDGSSTLFLSVYARSVDPAKAVKDNQVDYSYLMEERKDVARSIYVARFTFKNSLTLDQPLGMPTMSQCILVNAN